MGTIYIDGKPYEADPQKNLLHVCLSLGLSSQRSPWYARSPHARGGRAIAWGNMAMPVGAGR